MPSSYDYIDDSDLPGGRPGGDWAGIRPVVENPMSWAVHVGTVNGISIRVHALLLLYIVLELLRSVAIPVQGDASLGGFQVMALAMGLLVVLVLAHEVGHCLVCRMVNGVAAEMLLWPLGGLAACRPPNRWQTHLTTALGGPAVNLLLCCLAGGMLWAITGRFIGVGLPNLLDPHAIQSDVELQIFARWDLLTLYLINLISMALLLFNLLPMFPLDGGRILHAMLWPKLGYVGAMRLTVRLGIVIAVLLFVAGAVVGWVPAVAVAIFGAFVSWTTHRQLEFTESVMGYESEIHEVDSLFRSDDGENPDEPAGTDDMTRHVDESAKDADLDRVLEKIGQSGIESLSAEEQSLLAEATRRRRERGE